MNAIDVHQVRRAFGPKQALDGVSLQVAPGRIHALLGPNGAGKTTLLRAIVGLIDPDEGTVAVFGEQPGRSRVTRARVGFVPSGDRTFYLRLSGFENLTFFARLHGLSRARARERARACLASVGLEDAARLRVSAYSHGMQKRLSIARALLTDPPALIVDEATHDLDPAASRHVRALVARAAAGGCAVLWATQRLEELRGFAHRVTVLRRGCTRFVGTVEELAGAAGPRRHHLHLRNGVADPATVAASAARALAGCGGIVQASTPERYVLTLDDGVVLGRALAALTDGGIEVISCSRDGSDVEDAFLRLTEEVTS